MKNLTRSIVIGVLILLVAAGAAAAGERIVEGGINKAAGSLEVPRGTTVNGDVTVNMGEIVILGTVNGNVRSNMGQVTIHGEVNGDVEANMGQVTVTGSVSGSVRARMGEAIIDGTVAGNIDADLGSVRVSGTVGGDVNTGLGDLRVPGEVIGSVTGRGGNVYITGAVEGDVNLTRGIVDLGPQAKVGGRVFVEEGLVRAAEGAEAGSLEVVTELTESELARRYRNGESYTFYGLDGVMDNVAESIERAVREIRIPPARYIFQDHFRYWVPFRPFTGWPGQVARGLFNMIVLFALAALTYTLFPRQVKNAGSAVTHKTGTVFGWGLLAALLAIPLMVLLAITIIGIPLIIVEILFLAIAALLGYTAIAQLIGDRIVNTAGSGSANPLGSIALGALIVGVVSMVPHIGWLASLVVMVAALGAALSTRFGTSPLQPEAAAAAVEPAAAAPPEDAAGPAEQEREENGEGERHS